MLQFVQKAKQMVCEVRFEKKNYCHNKYDLTLEIILI
jgi:hypothetical protein